MDRFLEVTSEKESRLEVAFEMPDEVCEFNQRPEKGSVINDILWSMSYVWNKLRSSGSENMIEADGRDCDHCKEIWKFF